MNFIFWNYRGLGRSTTQLHLKDQINSHRPALVMLSETFAQERMATRIARKYGFSDFFAQPSEGRRNGFLIMWSSPVSISILFSSNWLVEMLFSDRGKSLYILFIHADSKPEVQEHQCTMIQSLSRSFELPWLLVENFNAMLHSSDKRGGLPINRRQLRSFSSLIENYGLCEFRIKGPQFTWTNGQQGQRRISEKIDRGVC